MGRALLPLRKWRVDWYNHVHVKDKNRVAQKSKEVMAISITAVHMFQLYVEKKSLQNTIVFS